MLGQVRAWYDRARDPLQSTEFSFTRFLVPWLCAYRGWAIFFDGDMICLGDVAELDRLRGDKAVYVVKHDHRPRETTKFLGRPQSAYARKNWSSVMMFNCERCTALTPQYVATASGLDLHQFRWLRDEEMGELPHEWNHLVGVDAPRADAKLVHYTLGMPFFSDYRKCEYAEDFFREAAAMAAFEGA